MLLRPNATVPRREARAAAVLSHPNVAGVFEYGEDGDIPYIVMELIPGQTLATRLSRGRLEPPEAIAIAEGIAEALQAAHDAGIVPPRREAGQRDAHPPTAASG